MQDEIADAIFHGVERRLDGITEDVPVKDIRAHIGSKDDFNRIFEHNRKNMQVANGRMRGFDPMDTEVGGPVLFTNEEGEYLPPAEVDVGYADLPDETNIPCYNRSRMDLQTPAEYESFQAILSMTAQNDAQSFAQWNDAEVAESHLLRTMPVGLLEDGRKTLGQNSTSFLGDFVSYDAPMDQPFATPNTHHT